ncbi:hypothetical protein N658DRAFT_501310 [Parathielavia hyrcaniae]|uniref:Uncharacterized protein n=1 Tax=Parathielavia hyrcaniae TaxID=113614 RepID=A0AAN6PTC6_9PEZI|nr:hypothetical protein N658DRAFT_501310 [Parathielavia hyrcaniae]
MVMGRDSSRYMRRVGCLQSQSLGSCRYSNAPKGWGHVANIMIFMPEDGVRTRGNTVLGLWLSR